MQADIRFTDLGLDFWAEVKLISQNLGYTQRGTGQIKVHTIPSITSMYQELYLDFSHIFNSGQVTPHGQMLLDYFQYRADTLNNTVQGYLMDKTAAEKEYNDLLPKIKWFITIIRTCFHEGHKFSTQNIPCLYTHTLFFSALLSCC